MKEQKRRTDDLTRISGIGETVQQGLRELCGVRTYADLSALTAAEIEAILKEDKRIPAPLKSRKKIEIWIAEATELAPGPDVSMPIDEGAEALETPGVERLVEVRATVSPGNGNARVPARGGDWKPFATFVVEFQTRKEGGRGAERRTAVHFVEEDKDTSWPGIEREKLCRWMERMARISRPEGQMAPSSGVKSDFEAGELPPVAAPPRPPRHLMTSRITPTRLAVFQAPDLSSTIDIAERDRPFLAHVKHDEPLRLQLTLVAPAGESLSHNAYAIQCHVHNLSVGVDTDIFDMETAGLAAGSSFKAELSDLVLRPGVYQLSILIKGKRPLGANFFELPKLNVL